MFYVRTHGTVVTILKSLVYNYLTYQNQGTVEIFNYKKVTYEKRYTDNTKRPKPKENQLGIIKIYAFCQKLQQMTSGPGERCWCYVSIYENAPQKLPHLPVKSCHNFTQWFKAYIEGNDRNSGPIWNYAAGTLTSWNWY